MNAIVIIAVLINSALYLGGVLATALVRGNVISGDLALTSMGLTYLGYLTQAVPRAAPGIANAFVVLSIIFGTLAGVALLF